MSDYFGPLWESAYGGADDPAIYAWTGALNRYSEQELAGAIKSSENWDGKYPPTFPEFKALVMASRSALSVQAPAHTPNSEPFANLEHFTKPRRGDSEIAKREKKRMAAILRGEDVESREESMRKLNLHARWGA